MWRSVVLSALVLFACGRNGGDDTDDSGGDDTADTDTGDTADTDTADTDTGDTADTDTADTDTDTGSSSGLDFVPGFWGASGVISDLLVQDGIVYVGGDFTYVGPPTGMLAAFHKGGSGEAVPTTAGVPHLAGFEIAAMISDGAGGQYIGGRIFHVDGTDQTALAEVVHILADGTLDPAFHVSITNGDQITALALKPGAALYIGGGFYGINGQTRPYTGAVDPATGTLLPWNPAPDFSVGGLAIDGDLVYVAGLFDNIATVSRPLGLAAIDASGAATSWNPNPTSTLVPQGGKVAVAGNKVYLWGYGFLTDEMVAFDKTTGALITGFTPDANTNIREAVVTDTAIWVGGDFETVGGQARHILAAIDPTTGDALSFDPDWSTLTDGNAWDVMALALDGTTLYAYVSVESSTFARSELVAFDTTTGDRTAFDVLTDGGSTRAALLVDGADLYLGDGFRSAGGVERHCLAAFDAATGLPTDWAPYVDDNGGCDVYALAGDGTNIYVGGDFQEVDGQTRHHLAAVEPDGDLLPWNPNATDFVESLYIADSTVYAGGYFTQIGGVPHPWVAAIDKSTGVAAAWDPDSDSDVLAFAKDGSVVYLGGYFESIGGQDRLNVGAVSDTTALATSWDPGADLVVRAVLVHGGLVYAGGNFDEIDGTPRAALAAIEADGHLAPWNPGAQGTAYRLAIDGDTLYAAGGFDGVGGSPATALAAVSLTTGLATGWSAPVTTFGTPTVFRALGVGADGRVYVAGGFDQVGHDLALGVAAFDP